MNMKKFAALILALAMCLLCACSSEKDDRIAELEAQVAEKDAVIAEYEANAADADRIAGRMLQAIRCGRGYKVLGIDGHLLSIGMRLCPTLTLRLCRYIIKASNLPLFADIWAD